MLSSLLMSDAMDSSTRTPGAGSPRQCTVSSMALWATVPVALATFHWNGCVSSPRNFPSQPSTEVRACLLTQSVSRSGRAATLGARRSSSSARSSARSRGSNAGRSSGRAPSAASRSAWAGFSPEAGHLERVAGHVGAGSGLVGRFHPHRGSNVTPQRVDWRGDAIVLAPVRPGRPDPRPDHPRPRPRRARVPEPASPDRGAALDQAMGRRRHGGGRGAGSAVGGGAGRPGRGHRGRQRAGGARCRPAARAALWGAIERAGAPAAAA